MRDASDVVEGHKTFLDNAGTGTKAVLDDQDFAQTFWPPGSDLRWASAKNTDLTGAVMDRVNICFGEFQGANLSGASLIGTILSCVRLRGGSLAGANLTDAKLNGADLRDVDMRGAITTNVVFGFTYLERVKWDEGKEPPPGWLFQNGQLTREE